MRNRDRSDESKRAAALYRDRKRDGLCVSCGMNKPAGWRFVTCNTCQDKERRRLAGAGGIARSLSRSRNPAALERAKLAARRARKERPARMMFLAAKGRASAKGVPFLLTADDEAKIQEALDGGRCEMTGVEFDRSDRNGVAHPRGPSLDRIVPALGYVPGNVRVVCHAINVAMGTWGESELREIVMAWLSMSPDDR